MNIIFALAFVATFVAIGVGTALWYAERGREIDADIARFIISIPPEAFEPDELWAARANKKLPADTRCAAPRLARCSNSESENNAGPLRTPAQRTPPPSGVGGTNVHPLRKDPT